MATIISASYRTDIPTFYGEWFMNRLRAGSCMVTNPYNGRSYAVDLRREAVAGLVLWTKNLGPFVHHLREVRERGYPFIVQYTINGYTRSLETSVVDADRAVQHMRMLHDEHGPAVPVWRYDPILVSSPTPIEFHLANFARLARMLEGSTDEVIVSFAQFYRKTRHNLEQAAAQAGLRWCDPDVGEKRALVARFQEIAHAHAMRLAICSQPEYLIPQVTEARCVDAERLSLVAGTPINARRKGNRPACACAESRDIGEYDTCPHGCIYCYAVRNRGLAQARHREHDPASEFLFPPRKGVDSKPSTRKRLLPLFPG